MLTSKLSQDDIAIFEESLDRYADYKVVFDMLFLEFQRHGIYLLRESINNWRCVHMGYKEGDSGVHKGEYYGTTPEVFKIALDLYVKEVTNP